MIDKERIKAEAEAFFEWPSKEKTYVTTTSMLIFANVIAEMARAEEREACASIYEQRSVRGDANVMHGGKNWKDLHDRFLMLRDKTSASKTSSYAMDVYFDPYDGIRVHLGTYDIADWPRHTYLGPFATEAEAMVAAEKKIAEAEAVVAEEGYEDA